MTIRPDLAVHVDAAIAEIDERLKNSRMPSFSMMVRWKHALEECRDAVSPAKVVALQPKDAGNG